MQQTNMTLAQNIKTFRKQNGLTQEEFAEKLGVTFQAVSKWETAKSTGGIFLFFQKPLDSQPNNRFIIRS